MDPSKLSGEALKTAVEPVKAELGAADKQRLDILMRRFVSEELRLSDALEALYPEEEKTKALASLTKLRSRFNEASEESKQSLRFEVDSNKRSPPAERTCWFTGPDPSIRHGERYTEEVTSDVEPQTLVRARGFATTGTALSAGKKVIRCFVSYARKDPDTDRLLEALKTEFKPSKHYEFEWWKDRDILPGEKWDAEIKEALKSCDLGLLLISPGFLGSTYVKEVELKHFLHNANTKPIIPVGMMKVDFKRQDLAGLEEHQIFLQGKDSRWYDDCEDRDKRRFAHELYLKIEERLDRVLKPPTPPSPKGPGPSSPDKDWSEDIPQPERDPHFQRTQALAFSLHEQQRLSHSMGHQSLDALKELETWAMDPEASPFFALLGEYGIGKTTTLKHLARELLEKRKKDPQVPLPIYVDLREYSFDPKDSGVFTTEKLLDTVIARAWKLSERNLTSREVLSLVRSKGALILFDGLDEKLVHLPPSRAQEFIRTLWGVLPSASRTAAASAQEKPRGKMLISCRSHYFRDVWDQNAMLVGEDREGLSRKNFPALCLLPFNEEQVLGYLTSLLGNPEEARKAFERIASIHDLEDLAQRPYLLKLIGEQLGELETLRASGKPVNAASLYELVVRSWLGRDNGKHQLEPAHKRRLMEALAAALWRSETLAWDADKLEEWLDQYLVDHPVLASAYANKDRAVLKEDLRTATFVLRPDTEQKLFRFAHTSLQEYFLAAHLARALREGQVEAWALPRVSRETLDFLGQILQLDPDKASLATLEKILEGDVLSAAVLGFDYWLRALDQGTPAPAPKRVKLAGADLTGWQVRGRGPDQPLNLQGADLSAVKLNEARVEYVNLDDANLSGLEASYALFLNVSASRANATGVDFTRLQWREGSLSGADLNEGKFAGWQAIHVRLTKAKLPPGWDQEAAAVDGTTRFPSVPFQFDTARMVYFATSAHSHDHRKPSASDENTVALGNSSVPTSVPRIVRVPLIYACAFSPDGRRTLFSSYDGTLKLWDSSSSSGLCLLTLTGHSSLVTACAFSPDGRRILSASDDGMVKLRDASSGLCLLTLTGHSSRVAACAFSPDGHRILSASDDKTLKLWDASSGLCLVTLTGHSSSVRDCAFSPDGLRILSASDDKTLKLWDSSSGSPLLTFTGHSKYVLACAFSPDGLRILSASNDKTLKLWDSSSGLCLLTLTGHSSSVRDCAFSPESLRILSSSGDGTLKLWDSSSGSPLLTLTGHDSSVRDCAFSPDGLRILSASYGGTIKRWDSSSGSCLLTFHYLREGQHATLDEICGRPISVSPEAWRWLAWRVKDPSDRLLPAEFFGPLPPVVPLGTPVTSP